MEDIIELNIIQFSSVYLLLAIVIIILKKTNIKQTKLLVLASVRMTLQLVIAGLLLTFILKNQHPIYTIIYILVMVSFAIRRVLKQCESINNVFKIYIALSLLFSGFTVLVFFIFIVIDENIFNAQYTIPIAGMLIGNSMTGISLGIKTFLSKISIEKEKINSLLNLGVKPKKILIPFVHDSLETALLPTLNSMLGMGVIFLPGMMTGQILAGTLPITAIMYQIAIMIAIFSSVCLTVFFALNLGYKTLYNSDNQLLF